MVSLWIESIKLWHGLYQWYEGGPSFQREGFQLSKHNISGCLRGVPDARDIAPDHCTTKVHIRRCKRDVECFDVDHVQDGSCLADHRIERFRRWIFSCCIVSSLCEARAFNGLMVRYSVGAHFIYASWYKKSELGTRAAIFVNFGHLGSMSGGWIQAGLLESLAGKNGLPAWRWIFIIVSVITIPIAIR